ncbi:MAG: choice-of-anchor Q domain-containing protein [Planctomycetota bacterium]
MLTRNCLTGLVAVIAFGTALSVTYAAAPTRSTRQANRVLKVPHSYATIQDAIDAAHDGDEIVVADGVYTGSGNTDLDFHGKAILLRSLGGPENCTINCNGTPEHPHRGFVFQSGETADAVVDGFRVINGATEIGAIDDRFNGAAMLFNNYSNPTIRNCVLEYNDAACWGGAVCCTNASPTLDSVVIRNNTVGDDGGALFAWGESYPVIMNSLIVDNYSNLTGGGVTSFGGHMSIINTTIVGNTAWWGSAIYAGAPTDVRNSIVWGNPTELNPNTQQIEGLAGTAQVSFSNIEDGYIGIGNIDIEPMFVAPELGDFHLQPNSPLIDAGDPDFTSHGHDFDGEPRVINGVIDIGPDEVMQGK